MAIFSSRKADLDNMVRLCKDIGVSPQEMMAVQIKSSYQSRRISGRKRKAE